MPKYNKSTNKSTDKRPGHMHGAKGPWAPAEGPGRAGRAGVLAVGSGPARQAKATNFPPVQNGHGPAPGFTFIRMRTGTGQGAEGGYWRWRVVLAEGGRPAAGFAYGCPWAAAYSPGRLNMAPNGP